MRTKRVRLSAYVLLSLLILGVMISSSQMNLWVQSGFAAPAEGPQLSINKNIPADPNSTVIVPIKFSSNGYEISSIVFSIDYNQTWLSFDENLPNAIVFTLPDDFVGSCTPDTEDQDGEIDCFVLDPLVPLASLPDGVIAKIKLRTKNPSNTVVAKVGFSANSPPTSFGDNQGQSVPGTTVDGSVQIGPGIPPVVTPWAFLPAIFRNLIITPSPTPPDSPTPTVSPTPSGTPPACENLIINSGFENDQAWEIPATMYTAGYSTAKAHNGSRSMRTGIDPPTTNVFSYSSARQLVTISKNNNSAKLRLWTYPISGETNLSNPRTELTLGTPVGSQFCDGDMQYILVLDQYNNLVEVLDNKLRNSQTWTEREFDLSDYIGWYPIKIEFGTCNDGLDGKSAMYVDDVVVEVCK